MWAERHKILDEKLTIPIARYGACNGWLDNQVAVTAHQFGKGTVYYVGAYLDESSQQELIDDILVTAGVRPIQTPTGVELRTRRKPNGEELCFVLNHTRTLQTCYLPYYGYEILSGQVLDGELKLPPYGVAIFLKHVADNQA